MRHDILMKRKSRQLNKSSYKLYSEQVAQSEGVFATTYNSEKSSERLITADREVSSLKWKRVQF